MGLMVIFLSSFALDVWPKEMKVTSSAREGYKRYDDSTISHTVAIPVIQGSWANSYSFDHATICTLKSLVCRGDAAIVCLCRYEFPKYMMKFGGIYITSEVVIWNPS